MMQPMLTRKNVIWTLALLLTLWLTWQTYQQDIEAPEDSAVRAVVRSESVGSFTNGATRALPTTDSLNEEGLTLNVRARAMQPFFNLFAIPAKHKDSVAASVEKPVAPAAPELPFKYMGAVTELNQTRVILDYQGEVLAVKAGDGLGVSYRLVAINKMANSKELVFAYLPMNITQTMVVSDVSEH